MGAKAFVHINNNGITLNGEPLLSQLDLNADPFPFDLIYKEIGISYPKYHKMDHLSKLGFLAVELLKTQFDLTQYNADRVAQLFQNSYASLDTDITHQAAIDAGKMPSPAIFVYTLPNIVMGEIAIRNGLYGENLFILADNFSPFDWNEFANIQLSLGKADAVLGGWIEIFKNEVDLRFYLVDNSGDEGQYELI
jgi:hypothetical protein